MGKLTVFLDKATNLKDADVIGKSDPYATVTLKKSVLGPDPDIGQFKSAVIQNNLSPIWGETYTYTIDGDLKDYYLHVSVKDEDIGKDDMLGNCDIYFKDYPITDQPLEVEQDIDSKMIRQNAKIYLKISYEA